MQPVPSFPEPALISPETRTIAPDWYADVPRKARTPILAGIMILLFGGVGFGAWGALAPLGGAVIAPGTFVATGQNKVVQHLEGGVISQILVREGDLVEAGQVLLRLDPTEPKAQLRRLVLRQDRLLAVRARLAAEIRGLPELVYPPELVHRRTDPEVAEILDEQVKEFVIRRETVEHEVRILEQGIAAIREGIIGSEAQLAAARNQLAFIVEEIDAKRPLLERGLIRRPEVLALERQRAAIQGQIGQLLSAIGDGKERIARERQRILHVGASLVKTATEQLREVQGEIDDVKEQIRVADNTHQRIDITSPVRGVVIKMMHHTPGGVIAAGRDIIEILPLDDELIIEGRVRPQDIDSVYSGASALVRLTALNQRITPMIAGRLIYVSADALPDDRASKSIAMNTYVIRVNLDRDGIARLPAFRPTPGMPVEIFIRTGERTFFEYLTKPFVDSFERAFRER